MKIVTSDQMRRIESRSVQKGVSTDTLMENAGLAFAGRLRRHLGRVMGVNVIVLVGSGNNGGDGLIAAQHLHSWGARVTVYLCGDRRPDDPKLGSVREGGVPVLRASTDDELSRLHASLESAAAVVDAVLGTGRSRPIEGTMQDALLDLADARSRRPELLVVAMDLPSGLNADTGAIDPACPAADITVTLGNPKAGLYRFPGAERIGRVEVVDIGVPNGLDSDISLELITSDWARRSLPVRPLSSHKGTFGRTMIVAGSLNYVGAAYLAGIAAARVGAGLVTLALPRSIQMAVAAKAAELTYLPLPEDSVGYPSPLAADLILDNLSGYDSLLVGCGMGQTAAATALLEKLLYSDSPLPPTVVDADGLNFLSRYQAPGWWERLSSRAIVTPHPGEMGRLTSTSIGDVEEDRVKTAIDSAVKWNKVVVLKGAFTVVAFPFGQAMLSPFANPGLATAGTGDVLAGAIAGLLAQGATLDDSAALGVYLHAHAGDLVRRKLGDTGMLASDLLPALPRAIKGLRGQGPSG